MAAALTAGSLALALAGVTATAGALPAQETTTTTATTTAPTTAPPTAAPTTAAPPTAAPTTATTRATTTTSTSTTTTTLATTTTTTREPADEGTPWALILILIGLLGAVLVGVAIALLARRDRAAGTMGQLLAELTAVLDDVEMSRDLAQSHVTTNNPQPFSQVLTPRFESLRDRLGALSLRTEDPLLRQQMGEVGETMLSFGFAAEAEWLLRRGTNPPTAEQLSLAGSTTYDRRAALDRAVGTLRTTVAQRTAPR